MGVNMKVKFGSKKYIIGKVIRIIDDNKIIVSLGNSQVELDDKIEVYKIYKDEIKDPENGKILGDYIFVKEKLDIVQVEENYSVAFLPPIYKTKFQTGIETLLSSSLSSDIIERKLDVDEKDINYLIKVDDKKIKLGDLVRVLKEIKDIDKENENVVVEEK
jgi:hypothetical protein